MGDDMYNYDKNLSSFSSSQDEISLFLRQILLPSSSTAASSSQTHNNRNYYSNFMPFENANPSSLPSLQLHDGKISVFGSTAGSSKGFLSASGVYGSMNGQGGGSAANVSSSSLGVSENDTDEYDCESEDGVEALAGEVPTKHVPSRSSSKRSRAAEVHNLSEKRRRSRINEKMKALQNLIPNSNKTDKASMLDEAIDYLKQLQLQVQMLSTMRNGLSLHPMCFPEGLQSLPFSRMSMDLSEENRTIIPLNMPADTQPLHHPLHYTSNLPNKSAVPNQPSVTYPSYLNNNSETSFGLESPILSHIKPLQPGSSSETRREDILQHQQPNASHSDTNPLGCSQVVKELESGALDTAALSFDMQTTAANKDNSTLQTFIAGRDQSSVIIRDS